jgi:hypothetical protein
MKVQKELWYFRSSPAAKVAGKLKSRWRLRELTAARDAGSRLSRLAEADGRPVVCLVDLRRDDFKQLAGLVARRPALRRTGAQNRIPAIVPVAVP